MNDELLAGRKTQTRRVVKDQNPGRPCRYGAVGDWLWVREGVRRLSFGEDLERTLESTFDPQVVRHAPGTVAEYIADGAVAPIDHWGWQNKALPAIHMPRGVCRLMLQITRIRCERLHAITEADARAEGPSPHLLGNKAIYRDAFVDLWQSING